VLLGGPAYERVIQRDFHGRWCTISFCLFSRQCRHRHRQLQPSVCSSGVCVCVRERERACLCVCTRRRVYAVDRNWQTFACMCVCVCVSVCVYALIWWRVRHCPSWHLCLHAHTQPVNVLLMCCLNPEPWTLNPKHIAIKRDSQETGWHAQFRARRQPGQISSFRSLFPIYRSLLTVNPARSSGRGKGEERGGERAIECE